MGKRADLKGKVFIPAFRQGMKTALWLLKLTIPVSLGVFLLNWLGVLEGLAILTAPLFKLFGLSGKASVVLITGYFTNIYSVIAVMATLDLPLREALILANMTLIGHALIVESGIQSKTGSSPWRMTLLRLGTGFVAALLLNLLLPQMPGKIALRPEDTDGRFIPDFLEWLKAIGITSLKIVVLVNILLVLQRLMSELGVLRWLERPFHPLLRLMGLPASSSFLWLVANTLGLSYGGAIMISQTAEGALTRRDADLLNHHIAISHSQLEDTLLFAAMGMPILWLVFPRFLLAIGVVWLRRLELYAKER
ncbi:MAG TPA: nucleoside recognition domain-containing protein [Prolixibacteraceae bacterium]|nr:nucleoside recognition domain-containing protein [Prolixibacteraceae bacterium]HOS01006.1 nucleoside recognition domain-containing protein [Prolixibacteraceae bacterium]HPL46059.1 nucleoside recognition domain-containing protein [Prolixibacteraceae bacterium]